MKDAVSKAFDRPSNKPIVPKSQPANEHQSQADKRSVIVTGNMNQPKQPAYKPVIGQSRPSVGQADKNPAAASNGFQQANKKQYGVNAVPTSRKA